MATPTAWASAGPRSRPILASLVNLAQGDTRMFDKSYYQLEFPASSGNYYVQPGLVVALNSATGKYVPYSSTAAYGAGSDTAVGILPTLIELSNWDRAITPIYHGEVYERFCYVDGGTEGDISNTIKSALSNIRWV